VRQHFFAAPYQLNTTMPEEKHITLWSDRCDGEDVLMSCTATSISEDSDGTTTADNSDCTEQAERFKSESLDNVFRKMDGSCMRYSQSAPAHCAPTHSEAEWCRGKTEAECLGYDACTWNDCAEANDLNEMISMGCGCYQSTKEDVVSGISHWKYRLADDAERKFAGDIPKTCEVACAAPRPNENNTSQHCISEANAACQEVCIEEYSNINQMIFWSDRCDGKEIARCGGMWNAECQDRLEKVKIDWGEGGVVNVFARNWTDGNKCVHWQVADDELLCGNLAECLQEIPQISPQVPALSLGATGAKTLHAPRTW
jgi:hypothetical protein